MSRDKGNVAEREVAKLLQVWWREVEPECEFVRTPLSGGWGGPSIRAGFKASGDLMTTADRFLWTVEVKRREAWRMDRLLAGKTSPVWGWWRQALEQGVEASKVPMLWLRQNRCEWSLMVPSYSIGKGGGPGYIHRELYTLLSAPSGLDGGVRPVIMPAATMLGIPAVSFLQ